MVINTQPTRRDLLTFGLALPVALGLLGLWIGRLTDSAAVRDAVWMGGGALSAVYLAVPPWRRAIYVGFARTTYPIGWVISHVILGAVFFLLVTPIGLLVRVFGKDPMERRLDPAAESYWDARPPEPEPERYFRQF